MIQKEEHEKRLALYRQGLNDREISERLYVSSNAITNWRARNDLPANNPRHMITPQMDAEMRRLYSERASDGQIARKTGMPKPTVTTWRRRNGLKANFERGGTQIHEQG